MRTLCYFLAILPAFAQLSTEQKVFDFQVLSAIYAKHYAPYEWKQTLFGFDAFTIAPWVDRVRATTSDLDFFEVMNEYVASLQDGHDSYQLPSNFSANLGFTVDIYDGKVLIDSVTRTGLPVARFDELVSVDGLAVNELLDAFAKYARQGNDRSTRRMAASRIVTRPQNRMPHSVDLGVSARVAVNRNGTQMTFTIAWAKSGVPLTHVDPVAMPQGLKPLRALTRDDADDALLGLQTSMAPEPAGILNNASRTPIWSPPQGFQQRLGTGADFFLSGTYAAGGFRIGFIRIPTYNPADTTAALTQFQAEIAYFQENTDGLVVDQMRNNGGSLCYGENIVANLIPTNFRPLGYEIRATYEYLQLFGGRLAAALAGNNQTVIDQYQNIFGAIQASYNGNQRRTAAVPLCTPSFDRPPATDSKGNIIAYKKPLIMLIDEFSVSTADSVPAMMQDNGRGLLVGWRTNGMGGSNSLNTARFQVPYSEGDTGVTLALMVRKAPVATADYPLSAYIENVGVRPDVEIDYMTRDNLVNAGRSFLQAFTDIIVQQIQKAQ